MEFLLSDLARVEKLDVIPVRYQGVKKKYVDYAIKKEEGIVIIALPITKEGVIQVELVTNTCLDMLGELVTYEYYSVMPIDEQDYNIVGIGTLYAYLSLALADNKGEDINLEVLQTLKIMFPEGEEMSVGCDFVVETHNMFEKLTESVTRLTEKLELAKNARMPEENLIDITESLGITTRTRNKIYSLWLRYLESGGVEIEDYHVREKELQKLNATPKCDDEIMDLVMG